MQLEPHASPGPDILLKEHATVIPNPRAFRGVRNLVLAFDPEVQLDVSAVQAL